MVYGSRRVNVAFTRDELTQFLVLIPISLKFMLVLSAHLCLGFPKYIYSEHSRPIQFEQFSIKERNSSKTQICPRLNIINEYQKGIMQYYYGLQVLMGWSLLSNALRSIVLLHLLLPSQSYFCGKPSKQVHFVKKCDTVTLSGFRIHIAGLQKFQCR